MLGTYQRIAAQYPDEHPPMDVVADALAPVFLERVVQNSDSSNLVYDTLLDEVNDILGDRYAVPADYGGPVLDQPVSGSALNGVTCLPGADCWAAGYSVSVSGSKQTLAQRWDGTLWAAVVSPNAIVPLPSYLYSVGCSSESDCWAVGYDNTTISAPPLIEHWDGSSWTIISSATGDAGGYWLNSVACGGASD